MGQQAPLAMEDLRVVFLGAPGAGKGTQAALLAERVGLAHVSTGDLFRGAVESGSPLGEQLAAIMDGGGLVPDELVLDILYAHLEETGAASYVLDGFPRTLGQAEALEGRLGGEPDRVIFFDAPADVLVARLTGRRTCPACQTNFHVEFRQPVTEGVCDACGGSLIQRPDDEEEAVRNRLRVYEQETEPLRDHYAARDRLVTIPADRPVDDIYRDLSATLARVRVAETG